MSAFTQQENLFLKYCEAKGLGSDDPIVQCFRELSGKDTAVGKVADEVYHQQIWAVSNSQFDKFARSPAHYWASLQQHEKKKRCFELGGLVHQAALEPSLLMEKYVPDSGMGEAKDLNKNTNAYKEALAKFKADNPGRTIIASDDFDMAKKAVAALYAHPTVSKILRDGFAEIAMFQKDSSGIYVRGKADYLRKDLGWIIDLKTTSSDGRASEFARSMGSYRKHIQAGHYLNLANACLPGNEWRRFVWINIELYEPFAISLMEPDAETLTIAQEEIARNKKEYAECVTTNKWPAYSAEITSVGLKPWDKKQFSKELA